MQPVVVQIVNKSPYPLPSYMTMQSAGMDICANIPTPVYLEPLERRLIPTGLYVSLPEGYEIQVRPRSGLALKSGLTVLNSPGTIDADYRGEIGVVVLNEADVSSEEELSADMMSLLASFSGKFYGRRSAARRKKTRE